MALRDASRRHEHVSALLSLSHALARAGTTEEVAARLTEAVMGVVECDQASAWVWNDQVGSLRRESVAGSASLNRRTVVAPQETPHLAQMVTDPQPMFFTEDADDPLLESIMTDARLVALAVVPIIAREVFLGLLTVGVHDRPERLDASPELLEKLTGVAALAAPALQNGRLIDELGRQVVHDGLTGVLNRTGFGRSVEAVLASAARERPSAGLLYVDLDEFKHLNDQYGHHVGDELLAPGGRPPARDAARRRHGRSPRRRRVRDHPAACLDRGRGSRRRAAGPRIVRPAIRARERDRANLGQRRRGDVARARHDDRFARPPCGCGDVPREAQARGAAVAR